MLLLTACNLPSKPALQAQSPTSPAINAPAVTPTPARLCDNSFFPNSEGISWEYSGNNNVLGAYSRTDTVTASSGDAFTLETQLAGVSYAVNYSCTADGLVAADPVQQYAGAILSSPDMPVNLKLGAVSGTTLPTRINPGDTWQQTAEWEASSTDLNVNGRFVFDYAAVGYENITVPFGNYNALRIDVGVRIQVSGLHIPAGSYAVSLWMAPGVGIVKSQGTSHVPQVDFSDSMELTRFVSSP